MPSSHFKTLPIPCRLLSASKRSGMVGENSQREMSKYLILHAHGGVSWRLRLTLIIFIFDFIVTFQGFYTHTSQSRMLTISLTHCANLDSIFQMKFTFALGLITLTFQYYQLNTASRQKLLFHDLSRKFSMFIVGSSRLVENLLEVLLKISYLQVTRQVQI